MQGLPEFTQKEKMTMFSTRAFGSLGLCSVAVLSGTLGIGELPAHLSLDSHVRHTQLAGEEPRSHAYAGLRYPAPFFLSPTSFPKAKSAKFCLLWSWSLTISKYCPQLQVCIHFFSPSAPEGCQGESCHQRPILGSYSGHGPIYNSVTIISLFETSVSE